MSTSQSHGYDQLGRRRQLLKKRESLVYSLQILVDLFLTTGLLYLLIGLKMAEIPGQIPDHYRILLVTAVLIQFIIYSVYGVYRRSGSLFQGYYRLSIAWLLFLAVLLLIGFVTKASESFSREVFLLWSTIGFGLQIVAYTFMYHAIGFVRERFAEHTECLIIGQGRLAEHLLTSINNNKWLPDKIVGCATYIDANTDSHPTKGLETPLLGDVKNIKMIIDQHDIKRVYIAVPLRQSSHVEGLHVELLDANVDLIWVPDIYALKLLNHSIREVAGLPLIFLNESPITSTRTGIFFKAIMDRTVAAFLLLSLSPFLIAIACTIKLTSKGPVFFKQDRHGWDGAVFKIWKFRSMYMHEESGGEVKQATLNDCRITSIGNFLRRTSIDELPQLINVLVGEMSLVGPRPHAVAHNDYYDEHIESYLLRHRIKPGITGLAQVNGCRGETELMQKMQDRVEYDVAYINNWSLWLDVKILLKTPFTLFSKNIY
jgi:putative colanic acid biosynthesis UDP-glucose lipid carrier transferase